MRKEQFAPWELEQFRKQRRETLEQQRIHFTRSQWRGMGRMVMVSDEEAVRVIEVSTTGNTLYLFSEEQTVERQS